MSFIHPRAFHQTSKMQAEQNWGRAQGALRHVIAQLVGKEVYVELDTMTGYGAKVTIVGRTRSSNGYATPCLLVEHRYENGESHRTAYPVYKVGAIVETEDFAKAKYDALHAMREEHSKALDIVKARHPEAQWGKYEMDSCWEDGDVMVRYTPQANPVRGANPGHPFYEAVNVKQEVTV